MPGIVLTLPLAPGKVEAWRRFCQELSGARQPPHEASRWRMRVTREQLALVESLEGAYAVMTLEADDVNLALAALIGSDLPFESWYRGRLQDLHGISLTHYAQYARPAPADEPPEVLFDWTQPDLAKA